MTGLRIVIGCDDAGLDYKEILKADLEKDDRVAEVRWEGRGCAISQASASMLVGVVDGAPVPQVLERIAEFRAVMRGRGTLQLDPEAFGDAVALDGVARYVGRVKCAILPWTALEEALAGR